MEISIIKFSRFCVDYPYSTHNRLTIKRVFIDYLRAYKEPQYATRLSIVLAINVYTKPGIFGHRPASSARF